MPTTAQIISAIVTLTALEAQLKKNLSEKSFPELNCLVSVCMPDLLLKEKENLLNNLIGKKYTIKDNSYIREIVHGVKRKYHCDLCGETMIIISQPYITMVEGSLKTCERRMIKVKSMKTGFIYEVMFNEGWICK